MKNVDGVLALIIRESLSHPPLEGGGIQDRKGISK